MFFTFAAYLVNAMNIISHKHTASIDCSRLQHSGDKAFMIMMTAYPLPLSQWTINQSIMTSYNAHRISSRTMCSLFENTRHALVINIQNK